MLLSWQKIVPVAAVALALAFGAVSYHAPVPAPATPDISAQRRMHILYGDARGGGHLYGQGKPCKSEFPPDWTADKVVRVAQQVAANDNIPARRQDNGYEVHEQMVDGVRVRVVVNPARAQIVTAYPTNTPRNPCPANDTGR